MLLQSAIPLLLATLAAAVPSKRHPTPIIRINLINSRWAISKTVTTSTTHGAAVTINADQPFDLAKVECLEACDELQAFYCRWINKNQTVGIHLLQGNNEISPALQDGWIMCAPGLPDPEPAATKRQSQSYLRLLLTNTALNVTEEFNATRNGAAVAIDSTYAFDHAHLTCMGTCILEYHCNIHDEDTSSVITLGPGHTEINPLQQGGSIICGHGLPGTPPPAATEARATEIEIWVGLIHSVPILAPWEVFEVPTNGTAVTFDVSWGFRFAQISCEGACDREFHCPLYDENSNLIRNLRLGRNDFHFPQHHGSITCKPGPPEVEPAAMEARASEPTIRVSLSDTFYDKKEQIDVPTNETAVAVNPASGFDRIFVECILENCASQYYHCILYNKSRALSTTLLSGWSRIDPIQKGDVINCKMGLPEVEPAALAARETEPTISVWLTNRVLAISAEFRPTTDGSAIDVETQFGFNYATVVCDEACDQLETFHCTLLNRDRSVAITLLPGNNAFGPANDTYPPQRDGWILCRPGLPEEEPAGTGAIGTESNDGTSVFTDDEAD